MSSGQLEALVAQNNQMNADLEVMANQHNEDLLEINDLQNSVEQLKSENCELIQQLDKAKLNGAKCIRKYEGAIRKAAILIEESGKRERQKLVVYDEQTSAVVAMKAQLAVAQSALTEQQEVHERQFLSMDELRNKYSETLTEKAVLAEQLKHHMHQLEEEKHRCENGQIQLKLKESMLGDLHEQLSELRADKIELLNQLDDPKLLEEIQHCKEQLAKANNELTEKDKVIQFVSTEVEGIKNGYMQKIQDMHVQLKEAAKTLILLESRLKEETTKRIEAETRAASVEKTLTDKLDKIQALIV